MILADKIASQRKKNELSQEELAEKMRVSRQAVSKWESAQSVPDLEKILALSRLFGVTTDYLLKDEIEAEEFSASLDGEPVKRIDLAAAQEFLASRRLAAKLIALGTFLCVSAPIPLLLLAAVSQLEKPPLSENAAAGAGLAIMLIFVAAAVAAFVFCGLKNAPFGFIDKEPFEIEYGVKGLVAEKRKAYRPIYARRCVAAACLCVLSPIPIFCALLRESEPLAAAAFAGTLFIAGIAAALFVLSGVRWASMQKLLKEGDYARRDNSKTRVKKAFCTVYWLIATAVYLLWSMLSREWEITWIVWAIAGVLFGAAACVCNLFLHRGEK